VEVCVYRYISCKYAKFFLLTLFSAVVKSLAIDNTRRTLFVLLEDNAIEVIHNHRIIIHYTLHSTDVYFNVLDVFLGARWEWLHK
jgi:hypothetical protein